MRPQKGKRFQGKGYRNLMNAGNAFCICPQCGYRIPHIQGKPCYMEICPDCHVPLMRDNPYSCHRDTDKTKSESKTMKLPEVNTELCIGCGICIGKCPKNAVSLTDGKAFIDHAQCGNCRICESECPMHAIS